jgi:hypothetical protein
MAGYNAYRWPTCAPSGAAGQGWQGAEDTDSWQDSYYSGANADVKQRKL